MLLSVSECILFFTVTALLDKHTLHNKFEVVYDSLKEIHTKLHESITPLFISQFYRDLQIQPLNSSLCDVQSGLRPKQIVHFLHVYWGYGLGTFVEPVLDILWKISYPALCVDPFYTSVNPEVLKDWRNIISEDEEFDYRPKTTQSKNLGKLLP
jgi:hypothetical protein